MTVFRRFFSEFPLFLETGFITEIPKNATEYYAYNSLPSVESIKHMTSIEAKWDKTEKGKNAQLFINILRYPDLSIKTKFLNNHHKSFIRFDKPNQFAGEAKINILITPEGSGLSLLYVFMFILNLVPVITFSYKLFNYLPLDISIHLGKNKILFLTFWNSSTFDNICVPGFP